jgi:hypothetical protein
MEQAVNCSHIDGNCAFSVSGEFCDTCDGAGTTIYADGVNTHTNPMDCIRFLKTQLNYVEQHNLEHDTRYCELEKSVLEITRGRKAALEESRTLKSIRETGAD